MRHFVQMAMWEESENGQPIESPAVRMWQGAAILNLEACEVG